MERGFEVMNGNMRRIALQPARQRLVTATTAAAGGAATGEGTAAADAAATGELALLACPRHDESCHPDADPKSLYDLWHEYLHGVGGKTREAFSETERGRVKYKFTRRKVVWDVVRDLVSLGHSSQRAIDLIYGVYGPQTSVTVIINRLRRDKKNGTINPNLRI
ncbi:hypothetical protein MHU86_20654 [Fragilaria crotonensis]|nr:hypothetical protein MHU86_20654 [Fragilaria crotonensis]